MKKKGRPLELRSHTILRIVESILDGASHSEAAAAANLQPRTLRGWLRKGASSTDGIFRELYEAVTRAEERFPKLVYRRHTVEQILEAVIAIGEPLANRTSGEGKRPRKAISLTIPELHELLGITRLSTTPDVKLQGGELLVLRAPKAGVSISAQHREYIDGGLMVRLVTSGGSCRLMFHGRIRGETEYQ